MNSVRVDKWLWAVRLFKSRTKANTACKSNRVTINKHPAKPSSDVKVGDIIRFKKGDYNLTVEVLKLLKNRRSYTIAKVCYKDLTPDSEYRKYKNWFNEARIQEHREKGAGRPTKRERRKLDDFKQSLYENDF